VQRSLRHKAIITAVTGSRTGVSVEALVGLTGVSPITVRRDLAELEALGALRRTHGGAAKAMKRGAPMPFALRIGEDQERKQALARTVAAMVQDDESLILDNGTTCLAVAHELTGRPLTVLALSLHCAAALASAPGARVVVPGGPVETDSLAFLGSQAVDAVRDTRADVAVLGACSASADHGLTATTPEDAQVKRACIASAARTILVATGEKLERTSTFRFARPVQISALVTTPDAPAEILGLFHDAGVDVRIAD
jgi:DeoR/GlpR family transcriptional regulator of sugar metabolism